jgi:hypothetical protein
MVSNKEILEILFNRKIIVFAGEYGRGKTLSMESFAFISSIFNGYHRFLSNIPVYFPIKISENEYIPLIESAKFDDDNQKTMILIDEMQRDLNSREFLSGSVKIISKFSVDLRKDEAQLIGSVQYLDRLEKSMNEILQCIIIPSFVNHYSNDDKKDIEARLHNHDFSVDWFIIDKKYNDEYHLKLNLYKFITYYNTKFKPYPLIINNKEYMDKKKESESGVKYENRLSSIKEKRILSLNNWQTGLNELIENNQ